MTRDDLNCLTIIASTRTEGDVRPEDVTSLHLLSTERETGLPPPDGGEPFRGIVIGLVGAIVLWTVLLWGVAIAAGWRPLRGIW